ncbi:NB-ARC domain-containing protein [Anabaena sp. PCC 7938]|uniref:helix-turn-helix transcriptional regulator n=1 Tax=Anabaena sp. PCC 7938 TaxID=1296340 RepID=UPI003BEEEB2F
MVVVNSQVTEEEFIEAQKNWELEKLYIDLASVKRKALTPVEKKLLRGLLCGCSPAEIANKLYQSRSSSTVRVYLSNGLYKYIEDMLGNQLGYSVKVKNWSHVTHLLEKAGYKKNWFQVKPITTFIKNTREQEIELLKIKSSNIQDWGEAIDISSFSGRIKELTTASKWILQNHCRLVVLLGMGGIGKTAFSIKLTEEIQEQFEYVIWRSLHLCPSIDAMLNNIVQILLPTIEIDQTATLNTKISQLISCLRKVRCLLVLDNVDSILSSNDRDETQAQSSVEASKLDLGSQIQYRPGYEGYGELIRRIGDSQHQSCLLLTSREKPPEIAAIEGEKLPVRSLNLTGLSKTEGLAILKTKGLAELEYTECTVLIDWYAGNPLFLKLVATTIQDLFGGSVYQYFGTGYSSFW